MKNLIIAVICIVALFPLIAHADYYSLHGAVLSTMDGAAHILTEDGNLWEIDQEDFDTGDRVFLVLDDMDTPTDQTDDVIWISWYEC